QLEQRPRVLVPGLDVVGVLGVASDPPGADHDDRREPRRDEIAEDLELLRLERDTRLVAVDRDAGDAEDVVEWAAAHQRREPDREVADLRAVADVAEVDDPGE